MFSFTNKSELTLAVNNTWSMVLIGSKCQWFFQWLRLGKNIIVRVRIKQYGFRGKL